MNFNQNLSVFAFFSSDPYNSPNSGPEEIEFSRLSADTTEISALASFTRKVAAD